MQAVIIGIFVGYVMQFVPKSEKFFVSK